MNPVSPCSIVSMSAPARRAITGVPVAIDSIATSPNGSGQPPSITVASAPAYSGSRSSGPSSPRKSIVARVDRGLHDLVEVLRAPTSRWTLAATLSRIARRAAQLDRLRMPFSGVIRPDEREVVARLGRGTACSPSGRPWWIVATQRWSGKNRRWLSLIATSGTSGCVASSSGHAGHVEPAVERGDHRRLAVLGEHEAVVLHVRVDDVEPLGGRATRPRSCAAGRPRASAE